MASAAPSGMLNSNFPRLYRGQAQQPAVTVHYSKHTFLTRKPSWLVKPDSVARSDRRADAQHGAFYTASLSPDDVHDARPAGAEPELSHLLVIVALVLLCGGA